MPASLIAGAIRRRLVGPIWKDGHVVTDLWLGDPGEPPLETRTDFRRAFVFLGTTGVVTAAVACLILAI